MAPEGLERQLASARRALDAILSVHESVAAAGYVSPDLHDGCFLYDFEAERMQLIDLVEYREAPFAVPAEPLPGSQRFRAAEELP